VNYLKLIFNLEIKGKKTKRKKTITYRLKPLFLVKSDFLLYNRFDI